METLLADILEKEEDLLFIGIGNLLKSDDGVGVVISSQINERSNIRKLTVEVSIENYIGKINSLNPGSLILIDCMDLGSEPGTYRFMELDDVEDFTFNTHNISLARLGDFLPYPTYLLGIQPATVELGEGLSPAVRMTANSIIQQINQINQ